MYQKKDIALIDGYQVVVGSEMKGKEDGLPYVVTGITSRRMLLYVSADGQRDGTVSIEKALFHFEIVPMTKEQTDFLDALLTLWQDHGGSFHGPNTETATIPLHRLYAFMQTITSLTWSQKLVIQAAALATAGRRVA